jgi:lysophospholipase L1-like esterase
LGVKRFGSSPLRRALWLSLVVAVEVLVLAGLCEGLVRALDPEASYARWRQRSLSFLLDEVTYWKLEPRRYPWGQVNRRSMRGPEVPERKPSDVYRILVLGGSAAFDLWKKDDATWPALLERELGAYEGRRVQVINAGTPGFSSYQSLPYFEHKLGGFSPDLVLVYELYNDSLTFRFSDRRSIEHAWRINARGNYLCAAAHPDPGWDGAGAWLPRTVDFMRMRWIQMCMATELGKVAEHWHRPKLDAHATDQALALYETNLDRLAALAQARGAAFGIVTQASLLREESPPEHRRVIQYRYRGLPHAELWRAYQHAWRSAPRVAARHPGAFVIPAHLFVPASPQYFRDEVHLTAEGSGLLARVVADGVRQRLWQRGADGAPAR